MLGSSWVAAQFAASQEGLRSMKLVNTFFRHDLQGLGLVTCFNLQVRRINLSISFRRPKSVSLFFLCDDFQTVSDEFG
jgi:hypothetical protein